MSRVSCLTLSSNSPYPLRHSPTDRRTDGPTDQRVRCSEIFIAWRTRRESPPLLPFVIARSVSTLGFISFIYYILSRERLAAHHLPSCHKPYCDAVGGGGGGARAYILRQPAIPRPPLTDRDPEDLCRWHGDSAREKFDLCARGSAGRPTVG